MFYSRLFEQINIILNVSRGFINLSSENSTHFISLLEIRPPCDVCKVKTHLRLGIFGECFRVL